MATASPNPDQPVDANPPGAGLSEDELPAWLQLVFCHGLGAAAIRQLLAAFGSPASVLAASASAWRSVAGGRAATALSKPSPAHGAERLSATLQWLQGGPHRYVLSLGCPAYPASLLNTADPPTLLFAEGRLDLLNQPSLAIVGSRHATPQGVDNAAAFAKHLSEAGWCVVSGLALGIDGAAHRGGLQGRGGTIAVVGTGLDIHYPKRHDALAREIAATGLMLSEFAPGTPPLRDHFPRRNRIIAGLTRGTLVVEAAMASGSLITARLASECGREVFAIPGSIHAPQAKGCHWLIKNGAKLVETAQDILEELRAEPGPDAATGIADDGNPPPTESLLEDPLLSAMGHDPVSLDALEARTGWPLAQLQAQLLTLELDGHVQRLPGGLMQRRTAA